MGKVEIIMRCKEQNKVSETVLVAFDGQAPVTSPATLTFPGLTI